MSYYNFFSQCDSIIVTEKKILCNDGLHMIKYDMNEVIFAVKSKIQCDFQFIF